MKWGKSRKSENRGVLSLLVAAMIGALLFYHTPSAMTH